MNQNEMLPKPFNSKYQILSISDSLISELKLEDKEVQALQRLFASYKGRTKRVIVPIQLQGSVPCS
jgi:hypothetical protein